MERLYYETKKISRPKATLETEKDQTTLEVTDGGVNEYLNKIARLIPSEIIAGYLFLMGGAGLIKNGNVQMVAYWVAFAVGLILTPVYLNKVAAENKPKINHIIVSSVGFIVWAYATTGATLSATIAPNIYDSAVASFILALFSLISGSIPLTK